MSNVAAVALYSLWIYSHADSEGTRRSRKNVTTVRAAADIVGQAKEYYGDAAVDGTWNAYAMEQKIYKGSRGMRMQVSAEKTKASRARRTRWWGPKRTKEELLLVGDALP